LTWPVIRLRVFGQTFASVSKQNSRVRASAVADDRLRRGDLGVEGAHQRVHALARDDRGVHAGGPALGVAGAQAQLLLQGLLQGERGVGTSIETRRTFSGESVTITASGPTRAR
jgi:hypothetical protein